MTLFPFLQKKQTVPIRIILFFDIGRGNCRGAIAAALPGKPISIFYRVVGEERIAVREYSKALPLALDSLKAVLDDIMRVLSSIGKNSGHAFFVEDVLCILSSPYYMARTTTVRYKSERPFIINKTLVETLIAEAEKKNWEKFTKENPDIIGHGLPVTLSKKILSLRANGYAVSNPYGKSAELLEVSFFETEMALEVKRSIDQIVKNVLSAPFQIEALSFAAWSSIHTLASETTDCLFVTIGKSVSEVSLVRGGSLLQTVSFPYGSHLVVRHVARKLKTTAESALFRLNLFHEGNLSSDDKQKIAKPLAEAKSEWLLFFEDAAASLSGHAVLPEKVFLFVDGDSQGTLTELISEDTFVSQTLVPRGFDIVPVTASFFNDVIRFESGTPFDTLLALGGIIPSDLPRQVPISKPPVSTQIAGNAVVQSV